jgi:Ca2+-dependent lipid-binding protein
MDPVPMWAVGGQCAALNYQTAGSKTRLNQSKFLENGGVGYVIKPFYLLSASLPVEMPKLRLTIRIISGQMLPKPDTDLKGEVIDPYVVLTVCDDSNGISACSTVRTETVTNNGFNPCWDEIFSFEISQPLSSFLYIKILDEDGILEKDDFIGYCTVPISCLLEGFRHFRLYGIDGTRKGDVMYASIFSQINIETIN